MGGVREIPGSSQGTPSSELPGFSDEFQIQVVPRKVRHVFAHEQAGGKGVPGPGQRLPPRLVRTLEAFAGATERRLVAVAKGHGPDRARPPPGECPRPALSQLVVARRKWLSQYRCGTPGNTGAMPETNASCLSLIHSGTVCSPGARGPAMGRTGGAFYRIIAFYHPLVSSSAGPPAGGGPAGPAGSPPWRGSCHCPAAGPCAFASESGPLPPLSALPPTPYAIP